MKKAITGILVAAGAAGVFLVYKNWDKIMDKLKGNNDNEDPGTGTQDLKPETGYQDLPFNKKVQVLQGLLQIKVDGHAGDQTNANLDFYYDLKRENSLPSHVAQAIKSGFPNLKTNGRGPVSDSNIDFAITPKGTGVVQFGTYTAGVLTPAGYITVKDSAGNTRRLLVG